MLSVTHPKPARIGKILTIAICTLTAMAFVVACGGSSSDSASGGPAIASPTTTVSPATSPTVRQAAATADATAHEHSTATARSADRATSTTEPTPTISPVPAATEEAKQAEVRILDFRFEPPLLEIAAGTTVTFVNMGVDHTATAKQDASIFDSGILHNGESFTVTFDTPGTIDYWCLLHPNMVATIVVR